MLSAGSARVEITPPLGTPLAGMIARRRRAREVLDPLFVDVVVFERAGTAVAMASCDVLGVERASVRRIREEVANATPVPAANVMVTATHTHQGPQVVRNHVEWDEEYVEWFEAQVAAAIRLAYRRLEPATVGVATRAEPEFGHNRRILLEDGSMTLPTQSVNHNTIVGPEGSRDTTLSAFVVENSAQEVTSVLLNYASHIDVVTGEVVSAEVAGWAARTVRDVYGEDLPVLYLTGASGDVSLFHYRDADRLASREHYHDPDGIRKARTFGRILGGTAVRTVAAARPPDHPTDAVAATLATKRIPTRAPSESELDAAHATVADDDSSRREIALARATLSFAEYQRGTPALDLDVQVIGVNGVVIVGLPGEPFVEYGLAIREAITAPTMVAGYANGYPGYIPTLKAFENGGYETMTGWTSRLDRHAGNRLTDAALDAVQALGYE